MSHRIPIIIVLALMGRLVPISGTLPAATDGEIPEAGRQAELSIIMPTRTPPVLVQ